MVFYYGWRWDKRGRRVESAVELVNNRRGTGGGDLDSGLTGVDGL